MMKKRFSIACAPCPNVVRRTSREAAGEAVLGFALRNTPTATMGQVTIARMIGMGRSIDANDIQAMLIALAASPAVGRDLVEEAVAGWLSDLYKKGGGTVSTKQARLVAAITAAMEAQSISQNTLGRKSGVSQSMISAAILGKYDPKEEKWRLLCETLGLDYDAIVDDTEEPIQQTDDQHEDDAPDDETREDIRSHSEEEKDLDLNEDERRLMDITSRYLAGHLRQDIQRGMDISLEDLYALLTICKKMQEAAEKSE